MWASVMFLIDILVIYLIGSFVEIPHVIVLILLAVVPVLGFIIIIRLTNLSFMKRI